MSKSFGDQLGVDLIEYQLRKRFACGWEPSFLVMTTDGYGVKMMHQTVANAVVFCILGQVFPGDFPVE